MNLRAFHLIYVQLMEETMTEESARRLLGFHGQRKGDVGFYNVIHVDLSRFEVTDEVVKKLQAVLEAKMERSSDTKALVDLVTEQVGSLGFSLALVWS